MEVELFTDDLSDEENYVLDDKIEDYLDVDADGERCGICMDIVIDRGVLDCCEHWFCFACIDNWATITSLCPLCQNEFHTITCVPVYDTVGGNKTEEDKSPGGEEWSIEGENNSLSFPAYYIDENSVACLDGDGCKIRSASMAIEEDSDIDTSIACDSCDKWYHAYCVGFDPDGTCESSWLCPRCIVDKVPPTSDQYSLSTKSYQHGLQEASQVEDSFPGRVSVSIADVGKAPVGVSLVEEENEKIQESNELVLNYSEKLKNTSSISNISESETLLDTKRSAEPNCYEQEEIYSPIRSTSIIYSPIRSTSIIYSPIRSTPIIHQNLDAEDREKTLIAHLHNYPINSVDEKDNEIVKDQEAKFVEPNTDGSLKADKMVHGDTKMISLNSIVSDEKETTVSSTGAKRKNRENRNADKEEQEANTEAKFSHKRIKTERNAQTSKDQTPESPLDEPKPIPRRINLKDDKLKRVAKNKNAVPDIMSLVQDPDPTSLKQKREKETARRLRLKKIMRRTDNGKDSAVLVQELREKIKEAVRNKSSEKDRFDPKLLEAFRVALSGPGTENRKPTLDAKAKKMMLEKGKVRESLTRKIYGSGGKRKRAWTRECEVEFWKHRCLKAGRPEKFETLKSVLDLLRDDSSEKKMPENEEKKNGSILSRLYLADNSVFPRNNDIVPVSGIKDSGLVGTDPKSIPIDSLPKNISLPQFIVSPIDSKGVKKSGKDKKVVSEEVVCKSDVTKGDKRKWALELLARKTAIPGKKGDEKDEDSEILKRNYPLLAQLPKDMRPILAPCRHNKLSMPVRQAQLNRLTEHFLKKANLSLVSKAAETELAVADAVNIEKGIADRSNSKLVYVNLCSQELLKRSDHIIANRSKESSTCSSSEEPVNKESEDANNSSLDMEVDEALRNTGLISDSPPNSPDNSLNEIGLPKEIDEKGPDNILEVDSHPDLDIYGEFEYNLEEDDLIGCAVGISKLQQENPKIKLVFSSINVEKPDEKDGGAVDTSFVLESQNKTVDGELNVDSKKTDSVSQVSVGDADLARELTVDSKTNGSVIQNSVNDGDLAVDSKTDKCFIQISACDGVQELSLAECEELYGPDKEPISVKYPETVLITTSEITVNHESKTEEKDSNVSVTKGSPSRVHKTGDVKERTTKSNGKPSENNDAVMKKVEAYIKEHIRPLCKSGVITADQYRWAVGKTTEKVMKYHSKEKTAKFLIKEGEKVKKLAEQYVEAAPLKTKD